MGRFLLQNGYFITKWVLITKWVVFYYKMGTYYKMGNYYKMGLNTRVFRLQFNPFDAYSEDEFMQRFRFSKEGVQNLETMFSNELQRINRGHNITPMQQLLVTLRFLATGSFQIVCADLTTMSIASANR